MEHVSESKLTLAHVREIRSRQWLVFFFSAIILLAYPHGTFAATPPVVYVAGTGDDGGDYICEGNDDQVQINKALQFVAAHPEYTTVHLKGPFTYVINDTVRIGGKTIFEGDSNAILKLVNNCGWQQNKAMIQELKSPSSDIEIRGFQINANKAGNPGIRPGAYYHNLITLRSCSNVKVHNMYLQGSYNDVFKISNGTNIEYYNCILHDNGHDGLYAIKCSGVSVHNNVIGIKCNAGMRFDSCSNCKAYSNRIFSELGGGAGIQVQTDGGSVTGIDLYDNKVYKTATFGFWVFGRGNMPSASGTRVHIHNNEIVGVRGAAIKITNFPGVLAENNVISNSGAIDTSLPTSPSSDSSSSDSDEPSGSSVSAGSSESSGPSTSAESSSSCGSSESSCSPKKSSCATESPCPPKKSSCSTESSCPPKKSSCSTKSSCPPKKSSCSTESSCPPKKSSCSSESSSSSGSSASKPSGSSGTPGASESSGSSTTPDSSGSSNRVVTVTDTGELFNAVQNSGTTIHLKGPFTYVINDSLLLSSNTVLEGEAGVIIKLARGLPTWGGRKCSIANEKAMLMIKGSNADNVTIRNVTIDGSQSDFYPHITLGWSSFNMATIIGCKRLTVQNVTFRNGCSDAMLLSKCSDVTIDKVTVNKCGHDGVYAFHVNDITVKNSKFINRTNSSCRFDYVTNGKFYNNDCTTSGGGYAGLELEDTVTNIEVYGNYFHHLAGPAIAHVHTKETNVQIHDNRIE
ncbi:MAG: right-handed parallel beta-helix repeat-containing protein [Candidatus Ozemobacteraceae bacterium]